MPVWLRQWLVVIPIAVAVFFADRHVNAAVEDIGFRLLICVADIVTIWVLVSLTKPMWSRIGWLVGR